MKHIIWDNYEFDMEDFKTQLLESIREFGDDGECEETSESMLEQMVYEDLAEQLYCEKQNLDIELPCSILAIADLGLWDGHRRGYKELGSNLKDCLVSGPDDAYSTWYVDEKGEFCYTGRHHDGTNEVIFRMVKGNISDTALQNFLSKVYDGTVTSEDMSRYTMRLGDIVGDVYGWKFPNRPKFSLKRD